MGSKTATFCQGPTDSLRARDGQRLAVELGTYVAKSDQSTNVDDRDVMVGLAVYYDCAERLGIDPIQLFDSAAHATSRRMGELVAMLDRRQDVTLEAFGSSLVELPEGPCYRPASV